MEEQKREIRKKNVILKGFQGDKEEERRMVIEKLTKEATGEWTRIRKMEEREKEGRRIWCGNNSEDGEGEKQEQGDEEGSRVMKKVKGEGE